MLTMTVRSGADVGGQTVGHLGPADAAGQQDDLHRAEALGDLGHPLDRLVVVRGRHAHDERLEAHRQVRAKRLGDLVGCAGDVATEVVDGHAVGAQQLACPRVGCRGVVAQDDVEAERLLDRPEVAPDLGAMALQRLQRIGDLVHRARRVPGVGALGDDPQRLLAAAAADEDRQVGLDRSRFAQRVVHRVARSLVGHALAVEQSAHQHDGLVQPAEPLTRARAEVDAEGVVLALEPGAADAEHRAAGRDVVERRGELGGDTRVAERVGADHQAEPDARA